jgi:hypothetical protein
MFVFPVISAIERNPQQSGRFRPKIRVNEVEQDAIVTP